MTDSLIERPKPIAFTLYDADVTIIDEADVYDAGRSATLRRIIREWYVMKDRVLIDTKAQYVTSQVAE